METRLQGLIREAEEAKREAEEAAEAAEYAAQKAREAVKAANKDRDYLIGAVFYALAGLKESQGSGNSSLQTLRLAKEFSRIGHFKASYYVFRSEIAKMLIDLDLLDENGQFKYSLTES